jgi:DNA-binding response OmpR family regulator
VRLLIIEDYAPTREALRQGLTEEGFAVDAAQDAAEGLWFATGNRYDAIVLDRMLPDREGLDLLADLRSRGVSAPVLVLTAKDALHDRIAGLNSGADDYLVKPFAFAELLARIQAILRRTSESRDPVLRVADLELDTRTRRVTRAGSAIDLTPREYSLLELLVRRHGEVVSRSDLLAGLYDFDASTSPNLIEVYIGYLRRKIERDGQPRLLHTRRGFGYVLAAEPA